jgi:hypothetical protein
MPTIGEFFFEGFEVLIPSYYTYLQESKKNAKFSHIFFRVDV